MAKLKLLSSKSHKEVSVPYAPGVMITLSKGDDDNTYILLASVFKALDLSASKFVQRLYKSKAAKSGAVVTMSVKGSGRGPLIALNVDHLSDWVREDIWEDKATLNNLSAESTKVLRSLVGHASKFAEVFNTKVKAKPEMQQELDLAVVVEPDVAEPVQSTAMSRAISRATRPLNKLLSAHRREHARLHKAYTVTAAKLPYWTLRDAANVLQVHESALADALIADSLLIREGRKLRPANTSMSERFYHDTNESSNVHIKPDMVEYLAGIVSRHKLELRAGAVT